MSEHLHHISDDLLVKFLLEECTPAEAIQVERWLDADDHHMAYFNEFKRIWQESKIIASTKVWNEEEAWERMKVKMTKPRMQIRRLWYYAAAAILLLIGLFVLFHKPQNNIPPLVVHQDSLKHHTPIIALRKIESLQETLMDTLSDQSIVTLNKHAALEFPEQFSETERRVSLNGEAFFSISPNKSKPFYINTVNDVEIRVVGTSFNVKSYDAFTEVIVETGIVEVRKFNRVVLLHPREQARINKEDSTIVVLKSKDKLYTYYRSKEFDCENLPLWRLVEVLNEAYGHRIVIVRKELRSLTLDTRFDNLPLEQIVELLSETFDITVEKKGNTYLLK